MAVIEGHTEQRSKYSTDSPVLRRSRERFSTTTTTTTTSEEQQDSCCNRKGQEYGSNHYQDQVENSFQKVMLLNCWTQS